MSNVPTFDLLIACPLWRLTPNGNIVLQRLWLSGELVSALACHPEYKLLSVCSIPQMPSASIAYSTFSWPGLLKHLRQMLISNTKMEEGKSCQNLIYALLLWRDNMFWCLKRGLMLHMTSWSTFEDPCCLSCVRYRLAGASTCRLRAVQESYRTRL